ncbi:UNVERIFIED_CONTAM: L-ascorbate oxidase [Sesamum latifolium]|uniref:L-ascorbate oxidase n=1 Tax=Sesamum latifolium TaxID=2727402 RepID=A0AAW2Y453_9LAMI
MGSSSQMIFLALFLCLSTSAIAGDPTLEHEWKVTYGTIAPLGVPQQGILINGEFPGPAINCTSNNNIVVNVFNQLDEPFLLTWMGVQQRKNSWQDGTPGAMCPILPGKNYTYRFQVHSRNLIPIPYDKPADEYPVLLGDWYNKGHKSLKTILDSGRSIGRPDGIQINGQSSKVGDANAKPLFTFEAGKTYKLRVCNVGLRLSVNFRIQGHTMTVVEVEGSHTVQNVYDSLDLHVGQCMSVLVTADQTPKDYYFVASSRWNLTSNAARPNPQGSYKYGKINITRTIKLVNTRSSSNGKLRFGINGVSHVDAETPLKLAEYYGVADKVFTYNLMKDEPQEGDKVEVAPNVVNGTYRNFVEIIFENHEKTIQTWHLDGFSFFGVAIEPGKWSPEKRKNYNLLDAVSRNTIQVYPNSWAAVMTTLDNAGMWNLRSEMRERAYLGQQLYLSVVSEARSLRDEYSLPETQELCGIVKSLPKPAPYT